MINMYLYLCIFLFSHFTLYILFFVLFQYLTIFNDFLAESDDFDEEKDFINHNFELLPQVLTIMASTLNEDVLAKTARYLFSVLELASETSDPMAKIGQLLSPQALGYLNEALKQSLDNRVSYLSLKKTEKKNLNQKDFSTEV